MGNAQLATAIRLLRVITPPIPWSPANAGGQLQDIDMKQEDASVHILEHHAFLASEEPTTALRDTGPAPDEPDAAAVEAAEPLDEVDIDAADRPPAEEVVPVDAPVVPHAGRGPDHGQRRPRLVVADSGAQTEPAAAGSAELWNRFDLGRSARLLHHPDVGVVRRTMRSLHLRLWHAPAKRMQELLKAAGAPSNALAMVQAVVDTCRACRTWTRPGPRAVSRYRLATAFNELVQWDICFVYEDALSHLIDECTRYSKLAILPPPEPKSAETIIQTITRSWLRHFGPMRYLAADGESGLSSAAAAQWAHRHNIELKVKAPRAHAWMVERHHELFRQIVHRTKSQLESEGIVLLPEDLYAECNFVKNAMISIGGVTPMQAVLGQNPPLLADFEPRSDVPCDDSDGV